MNQMLQKIAEMMRHGEKILIGIGEEFGDQRERAAGPVIQAKQGDVNTEKTGQQEGRQNWAEPFLCEYRVRHLEDAQGKRILEAYRVLAVMVGGKDYFVVSTNQDGLIDRSEFDPKRVVAPCGNRRLLQCGTGCSHALWDASDEIERVGKTWRQGGIGDTQPPVCPACKNRAVFNRILDAGSHYVEAGYQEQWSAYRGWLSQTLNRRLVVLELGAGFEYPGIIRWPFERVVLLNQKSCLIRVHSTLFQLPEELSERGFCMGQNPVELFGEKGLQRDI